MTTLVIALCGSGASAWLARQARRYAVLDRMRVRTGRRLPSWLEPRLGRMLDDAAIETPPLQVVQMWGLLALVVAIVGVALDVHLALAGVAAVAFGGPLVLHTLRHRRSRAVTAAIPDALERVAAELRGGRHRCERDRLVGHGSGTVGERLRAARKPECSSALAFPTRCKPGPVSARRPVLAPSPARWPWRTPRAAALRTRSTASRRRCGNGSASSPKPTRSRPRRGTRRSSSVSARSCTSVSRWSSTAARSTR